MSEDAKKVTLSSSGVKLEGDVRTVDFTEQPMPRVQKYFNYDTLLANVDLDDWPGTVEAFSKRLLQWFFVERVTGHEAFMALLGLKCASHNVQHFIGHTISLDLDKKDAALFVRVLETLSSSGGLPVNVTISCTGEAYKMIYGVHVFDPWVLCDNARVWLLDACDMMSSDPYCEMSIILRNRIKSAQAAT